MHHFAFHLLFYSQYFGKIFHFGRTRMLTVLPETAGVGTINYFGHKSDIRGFYMSSDLSMSYLCRKMVS